MRPDDEDFAERLAICLEGGDVSEARAREIAALERSRATWRADEMGRASGRPVDARSQTGAQAARGGGAR